MKRLIIVLAVAACGPTQPIVSDFNGSSVKLQTNILSSDTPETMRAKVTAEATRICQAGGKSRAEPASARRVSDYVQEDLYLCLD